MTIYTVFVVLSIIHRELTSGVKTEMRNGMPWINGRGREEGGGEIEGWYIQGEAKQSMKTKLNYVFDHLFFEVFSLLYVTSSHSYLWFFI